MNEGLRNFQSFLISAKDPHPENLIAIAQYVTIEGEKFANEVAAGIEALEQIERLAKLALHKKGSE